MEQWLEGDARLNEQSVPVWHMHESLERLERLAAMFPRVALGSSGQWREPGTDDWRVRMHQAFSVLCDEHGRPQVKLHGLRMMDPTIFSHFPFSSVDSTNIVRNCSRTAKQFQVTKDAAALLMREGCENHACAVVWSGKAEWQNELLID